MTGDKRGMLGLFNERWDAVPTVWLDTETTGTIPGQDDRFAEWLSAQPPREVQP